MPNDYAFPDTQVRDYVALAGVNRMFRTQLDDAVFKVSIRPRHR